MTLKTGPSNIGDMYIPKECDIIKVETFKKEHALTLAQTEDRARQVYNYFNDGGYSLYKHDGTESFFVKGEHLPEVADFKEYQSEGRLIYRLNQGRHEGADTAVLQPQLIVHFVSSNHDEPAIDPKERLINYVGLEEILNEVNQQVTVLEILDTGNDFGSYFFNSAGFPTFENEIISLVKKTLEELKLTDSQVKFVGAGTGGYAAIYYGKYFNTTSLSYILEGYMGSEITERFLTNQRSILAKYELALAQKGIKNHLICVTETFKPVLELLASDQVSNCIVEKVKGLTPEKMTEVTALFMNDKVDF